MSPALILLVFTVPGVILRIFRRKIAEDPVFTSMQPSCIHCMIREGLNAATLHAIGSWFLRKNCCTIFRRMTPERGRRRPRLCSSPASKIACSSAKCLTSRGAYCGSFSPRRGCATSFSTALLGPTPFLLSFGL